MKQKCTDCQHFEIISRPMGNWDYGLAVCNKHEIAVDFRTMQKVNTLVCVEEENYDRCKKDPDNNDDVGSNGGR